MSPDLTGEVLRMASAAGIVAAIAAPVGLAAAAVSRGRILPHWRPGLRPWNRRHLPAEAFDFLFVLAFIVLLSLVYPLLIVVAWHGLDAAGFFENVYGPLDPESPAASAAHQLGGLLLAAPVLGLLWLGYRYALRGRRGLPAGTVVARDAAFGVLGWLVLTPVVFLIHLLVSLASEWAGAPPEEHGLTMLGAGESPLARGLFGLAVCGLTPLVEEILFRGLLVGWAGGRWYRPWVLLLLAGGFVVLGRRFDPNAGTMVGLAGPVGFVLLLAVGLAALPFVRRVRPRFPRRTTAAVYATAALFATAHAAVWPTPIPLFALGLGLGYLAARSNGVTASVVAHGLFNAVSFVYLLRGPAG